MSIKRYQLVDYVVCFVAIAFCAYRLFYGCDLTDEGYYIALPWRFVLGDRPFLDEAYILQTAAIPLIPLVKLYSFFVKGTDGIILFTRFTYLFFSLFIAFVAWAAIKIKWPKLPFSVCLLLVAFIPYNTPNLSYNTLGKGLFTIGLFFGLIRLYLEKASPYLFLAGIVHGLAVFSYPTLGAAVFVFFLCLFFLIPAHKVRLSFIYLCGCLLPLLCIYLLLDAKIEDYIHSFTFTRAAVLKTHSVGPINHLINTLKDAANAVPNVLVLVSTGGAFILLSKVSKRSFFLPLLITLIAIVIRSARPTLGGSGANGTIINLALLSPFLFLGLNLSQPIKQYFFLIFLPSLAGGLAMACTSGNGWNASALLFINIVIFAGVLIYERLSQHKELTLIALSVLLIAVFFKYELSAMPDGSKKDMSVRLSQGPYLGIRTSPEKAEYYNELSQTILKYENKNGRLLVLPHLPAAYLFTQMKPATLNVWGSCSNAAPTDCENYFKYVYTPLNITVKMKYLLMTKDVKLDFTKDISPLDSLVFERQMQKEETKHFVVYGNRQE